VLRTLTSAIILSGCRFLLFLKGVLDRSQPIPRLLSLTLSLPLFSC
jgi:hypothetical protein